jgi:hypothetical protein
MIALQPMTTKAGLRCAGSALALLCLAGCGFPPPQSEAERSASESCREDANRVYDAQNRYQLSERPSPDTPFSGSTPPPLPSDGLSDRYGFDQMVSTCEKRSEAVPVATHPN